MDQHDFKPFVGNFWEVERDCRFQPGVLADLWPHETAVAWLRKLMEPGPDCLKVPPLKEGIPAFKKRMGAAVRYANANYDVEGLCTAFPKRVKNMIKKNGDRLRK